MTENSRSTVGKQTTCDQSDLGQHLRDCCQVLTEDGKVDYDNNSKRHESLYVDMINKQEGRLYGTCCATIQLPRILITLTTLPYITKQNGKTKHLKQTLKNMAWTF
ncbi:hypothetical protein BY996DRAFT_6511247 [Phakopsora pachyrhizi]|nr:hypothetical protein BY996DRAFT_6511247 [Phakopsora pachyrhizi]